MGSKPKIKMPIEQRAKIFSPFAALKGLYEALAEKEKIREPKKEISEDMADKLNFYLKNLKPEQIITIIFYDKSEQQYIQLTGEVIAVEGDEKQLIIGKNKIAFDDLYDIVI